MSDLICRNLPDASDVIILCQDPSIKPGEAIGDHASRPACAMESLGLYNRIAQPHKAMADLGP